MNCFSKKVTWGDEWGEKLVNIREIEYKYEPYFKVFMCYKEYEKFSGRLRYFSQIYSNEGINNQELVKRRIRVISNHIQCINDFKIISKKWLEMCHEFPYLSDLVIGYDVV
tara:strand:- start:260 stop:592 length:333 start_codon:yes stop_codon:yes gene_type:complete